MKKRIINWALALVAGLAWNTGQAADGEKAVKLFDGKDLKNWTQQKPGAWEAKDGLLGPSSKPGGYIWSKRNYDNFELGLDFKMSKRCNSGLFFRTDPKNAVQGGFEIQIFDSPEFFYRTDSELALWLNISFTILWLITITNAFNFIDSIDGLATGLS